MLSISTPEAKDILMGGVSIRESMKRQRSDRLAGRNDKNFNYYDLKSELMSRKMPILQASTVGCVAHAVRLV